MRRRPRKPGRGGRSGGGNSGRREARNRLAPAARRALAVVRLARAAGEPARKTAGGGLARLLARRRLALFASPLTRRIILLNLGGLFALLIGFLYLNQFREGLDRRPHPEPGDAERDHRRRHRGLRDGGHRRHHHRSRKAAQTRAGPKLRRWTRRPQPGLEFSINPDRVGPLLRRLVSPTRTRARIYDRDGYMLLDSRSIAARSNILRNDLPPPGQEEGPRWLDGLRNLVHGKFNTEQSAALRGYRRRQRPRLSGSRQRAGGP